MLTLFSAAFLTAAAFAPPVVQNDVLTPHKVAELRQVTAVRISPDAKHVAYLLAVPRTSKQDDGPAWSELHVLDTADGRERPFVTGEVDVGSIEWRPGKGEIAFLAKRSGDDQTSLYLIPVDGGEAHRAVQMKSSINGYSFSPDGREVALVATEPEPKELEDAKKKGFKQEVYEEDWRPARVWIRAVDDEEAEARAIELEGSVHSVQWSPVDDRLAVVVAPTSLVDDAYMRKKVVVVDARSGEVRARLERPGKLGQVEWSPDGRLIAMIAAADLNDPSEGRLVAVPADGGAFTDLVPRFEGHVSEIAWQGARGVMYLAEVGVSTVFERVSAEAGAAAKPTQILGPGGPILTGLSLSADGSHGAFVAQTPEHPPELYTMSHGDAGPLRRTNSNPWLDGMRLARQEEVRFKARDGLELQGILIHPLDEVAGQRYPLILYVHGGPEAHDSNGWLTSYSRPGQVAAARGFAVFHVNYRGSTGRGVEFSKLSQGDPGGAEFDDLVDAVEHLVATGLVDEKKVGVTGGSYGGYATAWCATKLSEHFAAGVMMVGIADKLSKIGTTDIPEEEYLVHARKRVWEDWQFFLERSPIFHADEGRTPLLIVHGKDDPRVNSGQSRELYRHLKLRGEAPVRLVLYPGEGHGNRKCAARLDYSLRMLEWFAHYLQGEGGAPPDQDIDHEPPPEPEPPPASAGQ